MWHKNTNWGTFLSPAVQEHSLAPGERAARGRPHVQRQQASHARTRAFMWQNQHGLCIMSQTLFMYPLPPLLPPALFSSYCRCLVHPSVTISKPQKEVHSSGILKGKKAPPARWLWQFWQLGKGMCSRPCSPPADLPKHILMLLATDYSIILSVLHLPWEGQISLSVL